MLDGSQRRRWIEVLVAMSTMALLGLGTAYADKEFKDPTDPKAKKHLDTGNRHYKLQNFTGAIAQYKAGALIEDVPIFLYNLGQSHRQQGDYANAIWYYKRYLTQGTPSEARKKWVQDVIRDMNKELQRAARTKPPTGPGPGGSTMPPVVTKQPRPHSDHVPWHSDTMGWTITGVGVLGLGLGLGLFINAADLESRESPDQVQNLEWDRLAASRRTLGTVSALIGGALVVGGIIKLIINPQPKRVEPAASTVSFAVGQRWVGLVGRF